MGSRYKMLNVKGMKLRTPGSEIGHKQSQYVGQDIQYPTNGCQPINMWAHFLSYENRSLLYSDS